MSDLNRYGEEVCEHTGIHAMGCAHCNGIEPDFDLEPLEVVTSD